MFNQFDQVIARPKNGDFENEFSGQIILVSLESEFPYIVEDQDGECFACSEDQLELENN